MTDFAHGRQLSRAKATAFYKKTLAGASGAEASLMMRRLCEADLFYLMRYVLGRADMEHDWLYARIREVEASPDDHIDLWARDHRKSSIITFGKTIQDLLINPEERACIFSHTKPIAKKFLVQIMREFEQNKLLYSLFPDVLWKEPKKEAPKWSEDEGIVLKRKANPKEPTLYASGLVDGQPTGMHFSLVIYDDIVTRDSVWTADQIKKTTEAWELSLNLPSEDARLRYIGTRYHANDTYATMLERQAATPRVHPATVDGTDTGEPVLLRRESLQKKRRSMGLYTFSCQMLLNPFADKAQGFNKEWVRYWSGDVEHWQSMTRILLVDPAGEKKSSNDYTVMAVMGLGEDNNYYLIYGIRDRMNLTERASKLFDLHRQYAPQHVVYEKYGMQSDIEHIEYVQNQKNYRFSIQSIGGNMPKKDRIRRLVPIFETGRFFLPTHSTFVDYEGNHRDFVRLFIDEEFSTFPACGHDDMLDCLARVVDPNLGATFPDANAGQSSFGDSSGVYDPYGQYDWAYNFDIFSGRSYHDF